MLNYPNDYPDKFEKWLKKFKPDYLKYYERGHDKGEIDIICKAIYNHSDKLKTHSSFSEVLIDADVMQHCLYNPFYEVADHEKVRFEKLKLEFGLN